MSENPELPPAQAPAPFCRKSLLLIVGTLVVAAALAAAYALRFENPVSGVLAPVAQNSAELSALEQRLASFENVLRDIERSTASAPTPAPSAAPIDLTPFNEAITKLEERLAQVESRAQGDQQNVRRFVTEAFAFWELREAARSGTSFESQLAALRAHADPTVTPLVATLEPYAASGALTLPQLRRSLASVEQEIPQPSSPDVQPSIWEKIKAAFQPLIAVRTEKDPRFAALEDDLNAGRLTAALEAAKELPPEAQAPLAAWRTKLEARIAVDNALAALSAHFLEPPSTEEMP